MKRKPWKVKSRAVGFSGPPPRAMKMSCCHAIAGAPGPPTKLSSAIGILAGALDLAADAGQRVERAVLVVSSSP